jgi:APA family basic amino acid/polyamine antiporter
MNFFKWFIACLIDGHEYLPPTNINEQKAAESFRSHDDRGSLVIGMGIFQHPSGCRSQSAGTPGVFFLAWLDSAASSHFAAALTYAEIGSRYPVTGAYYKIFSLGYHPSLAFAVNCIILVSNAGSTAIVGACRRRIHRPFLLWRTVPPLRSSNGLVTPAPSSFSLWSTCFGLRMSSRVQNILTVFKITARAAVAGGLLGHYPLPAQRARP